jgi:hypothetical protein
MGNSAGTGFGIGIANMFGFGQLIPHPLTTKTAEFQSANQKLQMTLTQQLISLATQQVKTDQLLEDYIKSSNRKLQTVAEANNQLIWDSIQSQGLTITTLCLLIFLILIYILL